jgi:hypothetical protein
MLQPMAFSDHFNIFKVIFVCHTHSVSLLNFLVMSFQTYLRLIQIIGEVNIVGKYHLLHALSHCL